MAEALFDHDLIGVKGAVNHAVKVGVQNGTKVLKVCCRTKSDMEIVFV